MSLFLIGAVYVLIIIMQTETNIVSCLVLMYIIINDSSISLPVCSDTGCKLKNDKIILKLLSLSLFMVVKFW